MNEQTAIAAFLDRETTKIDALVAEQEKLLTLLAEKRQATISRAVTKGLDPDVPMKDSGVEWLGEVPVHWEMHRGRFLYSQGDDPPEVGDGVVTAFRDGQVTLRENRRVNLTSSTAYTGKPNFSDQLPNLETPSNWADNYGQRLTGFLQVPVEGDYVFLIASDDESALWLNTSGEAAAGPQKIAFTTQATGRYQWSRYPSQKSASIHLVPGKRYYIQALHKEGGSDDYLAVAYRLASQTDAQAQVIPGVLLSPPDGVTAESFDSEMSVRAGEPQSGYWPGGGRTSGVLSRGLVRATAQSVENRPRTLKSGEVYSRSSPWSLSVLKA